MTDDRRGADLGPAPAAGPSALCAPPAPEAPFARPLDALERVLARDASGIRTRCTLAPDEPFFRGHYPGRPILPGVFIVEAVHQAVRHFAADDGRRPRLEEVRLARFLAPVRPGDVLECDCRCVRGGDGRGLEVDARGHTAAGLVAQVRLLYRLDEGDDGDVGQIEGEGENGDATPVLDHAQIQALLPHRHPMLLVDAVTRLERWVSLVAIKNVTANEPCYARLGEAVGRRGYAYPCSLVLESFAQTAAILLGGWWRDRGAPPDAPLLLYSVAGARFTGQEAYPGDTLEHHTRVQRHLSDVAILGGEARVRGRRVAAIDRMVVKRAPRPAGDDPRTDEGGAR